MLSGKEMSDRPETLQGYRLQQGHTSVQGFTPKTQKLTTQDQFPEFPVCFFCFLKFWSKDCRRASWACPM